MSVLLPSGRAGTSTRLYAPNEAESPHYAEGRNGMVVSVSAPASDVGVSLLKQGGNAVDAAVATAFALAVTYPLAGNLGGGGFLLVHPAASGGEPAVFDYRETAPAAAWPTMYAREESQFTHRAIATPGTVRGLALAHRRFGTLPWSLLLQPAIALARDGFVVDAALARSTNETLAAAPEHPELQRVYGRAGGGLWEAGDRMVLPDLAQTLHLLATLGPDAFYTGPIAAALIAEMEHGGGLITAADLADYRAIERKPLTTRYRGTYDIYVPPLPSAGGVCLLEELNMLERYDLTGAERWSAQTVHLMAETMRRAQYDRALYPGDPAFVQNPDWLTSKAYARERAATIDLKRATRSAALAADIPLADESTSTTHFGVTDRDGMAVANTYTLERRWGSRVMVKNRGFLLNNNMRAFNLFPGETDTKGNVGTPANAIAPGKRPISSMAPTIVTREGRVLLVTGSTGSRAIPNTLLNILVSVLDFGMPVQEAVRSPRFSQEWFPDHIRMESPERLSETVEALKRMGHTVVAPTPLPFQGDAHTIWRSPEGVSVGAADRRISGKASGY
jgi:gamma-glutamyltranspeptidase/glutathione hydrolase